MKIMSPLSVWAVMTVAMAGAIVSDAAQARSAFDGGWSVQIITNRGACDPNSRSASRSATVSSPAPAAYPVRGKVAGNGAVTVSVASGERNANGSGRLSGNSGGGTWHGVGSQGACSGRWSASRQ